MTELPPTWQRAAEPQVIIDRLLSDRGGAPAGYRPADWAGVQPDPYELRRWRQSLAHASAAELDAAVADLTDLTHLTDKITRWCGQYGRGPSTTRPLQPHLLAQALAVGERTYCQCTTAPPAGMSSTRGDALPRSSHRSGSVPHHSRSRQEDDHPMNQTQYGICHPALPTPVPLLQIHARAIADAWPGSQLVHRRSRIRDGVTGARTTWGPWTQHRAAAVPSDTDPAPGDHKPGRPTSHPAL